MSSINQAAQFCTTNGKRTCVCVDCGVLTRSHSRLSLLQECQSLIVDNRRLLSATDRQARGHPSMVAVDHHQQLYHNYHQLQQQQQRQHRHPAPPSATRGVSGGGCGGGCGTPTSTVETVVLQTQIDTLQWQLKQVDITRVYPTTNAYTQTYITINTYTHTNIE